jgi:ferritin-like metal-binding protein YciE
LSIALTFVLRPFVREHSRLALSLSGSRVEHYEIAGYTTAISLATQLGENETANLLKESLKEEEAAENKLRTIAQTIIKSVPTEEAEDEEEEAPKAKAKAS